MGLDKLFSSKSKEDKELLDNTLAEIRDNSAQAIETINYMRAEMDSMRLQIKTLTDTVEALAAKIDGMAQKPAPQPMQSSKIDTICTAINAAEPQGCTPAKKAAPPKRKFYARYSPTQDILSELPDDRAERASFVAEVVGNKGVVKFNRECTANALGALSSMIYPFFDYDLKSDNPTSIIPDNEVPITHISGTNWKMDGKIKLTIC